MRLMLFGPRIFGIRPGVSFTPQELFGSFGGSRQKPVGEQMTGSFVYVVRGDHNMTKIGVSTNPNARLAQLRTGSAFPIDFAFIGSTPGTGYDIEQGAHSILDRHRCSGEWFDVPPEMAVAAVHASAHRINQPILQVSAQQVEQILRIAYSGNTSSIQPPSEVRPITDRVWIVVASVSVFIILVAWALGRLHLPPPT